VVIIAHGKYIWQYYNIRKKNHRVFLLSHVEFKGIRGDPSRMLWLLIRLTFSCPSATISYWSKLARPCRSPVCAIHSGSWPGQSHAADISLNWTCTRTASWCRWPGYLARSGMWLVTPAALPVRWLDSRYPKKTWTWLTRCNRWCWGIRVRRAICWSDPVRFFWESSPDSVPGGCLAIPRPLIEWFVSCCRRLTPRRHSLHSPACISVHNSTERNPMVVRSWRVNG